jgi:hypothetical protein
MGQYWGPVLDFEDLFICGIIAEKAGIKSYNSVKFVYEYHCNDLSQKCFMFNLFLLIDCKTGNNSIEFLKESTPETCKSSGNSMQSFILNTNILIILSLFSINFNWFSFVWNIFLSLNCIKKNFFLLIWIIIKCWLKCFFWSWELFYFKSFKEILKILSMN